LIFLLRKPHAPAGWTTASRQEVAYISSSDGKSEYILAVIGDDKAYGNDKTIFPKISQIVAKTMLRSN
jgi:hypothetical protein